MPMLCNRLVLGYGVPLLQRKKKRVLMRNLSHENEFDLYESEPVEERHFHMNFFALRLFLAQKPSVTWRWPIGYLPSFTLN